MTEQPNRVTASLKLATWNIHYGIGADRCLDMRRIVAVLDAIDADVIGLQEVGWHRRGDHRTDQFAYLRDHTAYDVVEGLVRDPLRARFGNAILTRIPVRETCWIDLKVMGHVPRAALAVELETDVAPLRVIVAHLGLTPWERVRQARRLISTVTAGNSAPLPTALLGDFNILRSESRASRELARYFPTCARSPTYPARKPLLALDRIYLSAEWELAETRVLHAGLVSQASDHLPLIAQAHFTSKTTSLQANTVN